MDHRFFTLPQLRQAYADTCEELGRTPRNTSRAAYLGHMRYQIGHKINAHNAAPELPLETPLGA